MNWFEMPEATEQERARKEIAECNHCISGLITTIKQMRIPKQQWKDNVMVKAYLERIKKAKLILLME